MAKPRVIVLGAGVSGLAAAAELAGHGFEVQLIEARGRIGGRIHTVRDPALSVPIELGAEFVHGKPEETFEVAGAAGLALYDVLDRHHRPGQKGLECFEGFWDRVGDVMEDLDDEREPDRSAAAYLEEKRGKFPDEDWRMALAFIEGFHGADPKTLSERGLAISEQATGDADASQAFRVFDGYDRVPTRVFNRIPHPTRSVFLNRMAREVRWKKGHVEVDTIHAVDGVAETFTAEKIVVTLPLGVLKAPADEPGSLRISPEPPAYRAAIDSLRMGHALRLILRFRTRVWESVTEDPVGYLHAEPDAPFPTWWTSMPVRAPLITAWAGGPKAEGLAKLPEKELVRLALETLSKILSKPVDELRRELQAHYYHDWLHDPFCRGAYSYISVDGVGPASRFSEPIEETLYFAGEATQMKSTRATVDGAMATGLEAAQKILRSRG